MKHKKPDRWTRTVLAEMKKYDTPCTPCIWLNGPDVVKLLRKQHKAVVDVVRKEMREVTFLEAKTRRSTDTRDIAIADCLESRVVQCQDILMLLKKRAT